MTTEVYMGIRFPDALVKTIKEHVKENVVQDWGVTNDIRDLQFGWVYFSVYVLAHELAELGIPCSIYWERENEDTQVNYIHVRFTEDEAKIIEVYAEDFYVPLTDLKSKLELSSHAEVTEWVDQMLQSTEEPPWDNQEELGKRYAFIKLLEK